MTETDAKNTRCCGNAESGELRTRTDGTKRRYCIASTCMAWRWKTKPGAIVTGLAGPSPGDGYCGLAGAS